MYWETPSDTPTIGNGALRTVQWYDGQRMGDTDVRGEFRAPWAVVGDLIDDGMFAVGEPHSWMQTTVRD